jgi:D-alanine-D-alanine ligase
MTVGLIYDVFDAYPWQDGEAPDADAEYEPVETVDAIAAAVRAIGHEPVHIGTAFDLQEALRDGLTFDAAINISEGARSRNREAYAPILLEMAGVPCLGSDALTLSLTLDKAWTKDIVAAAGIPTPPHRVFGSADDIRGDDIPPLPLFVKPRHEGSSKGIAPSSRVDSVPALRAEVERQTQTYQQEVIVESFVQGGGEFTVGVIGHNPPEPLPVLQRAVETTTGIGLHALEHRGASASAPDHEPAGTSAEEGTWSYELAGELDSSLEAELQALTLQSFEVLDCLDFARADFRVDRNGQPWFLETNPLPTFAPDGTFAIAAELMGVSYEDFLADVFQRGFTRLEGAGL